jgi:CheY-like chemotaxis protein
MPEPGRGKPVVVLVVEDSPTDALMTQEAFETSNLMNRLFFVDNGADALAFLRGQGRYAGKPRPDLILLDLSLPKRNGREVLQEIKTDVNLKTIPVVILSSSKAEEDVLKSYDLHANCYITKPIGFDKLAEVVQHISDFWLNVATLPRPKP